VARKRVGDDLTQGYAIYDPQSRIDQNLLTKASVAEIGSCLRREKQDKTSSCNARLDTRTLGVEGMAGGMVLWIEHPCDQLASRAATCKQITYAVISWRP
jgi:hypothetical protein